jgi:MFS family permease
VTTDLAEPATTSAFSRAYKSYALAGLTAVWTVNLLDRGLMSLLLQPIKQDMHLSDTQLGFVNGIAFALFYAVMGLPIARWADRGNRVTITALAIGAWGLTVMACLLVTNYLQLVAARIAAAVGEAGCKPPTYSLVGDYFPEPAERTEAMAIYLAGAPIASLISFLLGGWLNLQLGWRMTFFVMGVPGLVLALIVKTTIREPRAPRRRASGAMHPPLPPVRLVFARLLRRSALRDLSIALVILYGLGSGLSSWFAAFLIRTHGMDTAQVGVSLGLIFSVCGLAGTIGGGYLTTRLAGGGERNKMLWSAASTALLVPAYAAFLLLPGRTAALAALAPAVMCVFFSQAPAYSLMQRLVPDDMRAAMMGVIMLLVNAIGTGLGPQVVGIVTDLLTPLAGADALRWAMLSVVPIALLSSYHFWRAAQTIEANLLEAMPDSDGAAGDHPGRTSIALAP